MNRGVVIEDQWKSRFLNEVTRLRKNGGLPLFNLNFMLFQKANAET